MSLTSRHFPTDSAKQILLTTEGSTESMAYPKEPMSYGPEAAARQDIRRMKILSIVMFQLMRPLRLETQLRRSWSMQAWKVMASIFNIAVTRGTPSVETSADQTMLNRLALPSISFRPADFNRACHLFSDRTSAALQSMEWMTEIT